MGLDPPSQRIEKKRGREGGVLVQPFFLALKGCLDDVHTKRNVVAQRRTANGCPCFSCTQRDQTCLLLHRVIETFLPTREGPLVARLSIVSTCYRA